MAIFHTRLKPMVNHWIFVSVPFTDFNIGTIHNMHKKIRTTKNWSIGKRTPNRTQLSLGDKVLFYQGGDEGRKIVASAELASTVKETEISESFVEITNFRLWKKPVEIRALINELSFIKNKKHWGIYLQGGIVKISEQDYKKIKGKAGTLD